jgi:hypothetical protein
MKRRLLIVLTLVLIISSTVAAKPKKSTTKKGKKACATNLASCPPSGCGSQFDPELNKAKNITTLGAPENKDYSDLAGLPDPVPGYTLGDADRSALQGQGEGKAIRIVAYVLTIRHESGESCNCGLTSPQNKDTNTDNHLVIVDPALSNPTLANDEPNSQTAEFTPRVRLNHPHFNFAKVNPLLQAGGGKLLVRITGQQMYDSEHAKPGRHLKRNTNWEIHPIFKFEYCPKNKSCTKDSDANWVDLDQ